MESVAWTNESPKRRGARVYRGESEILYDILYVASKVGGEGIRRTRLLQLANLNTRSSRHYISLLVDAGALRETEDGRLAITGRGRLMLYLLGLLNALVSGSKCVNVAKLCSEVEANGMKCSRETDVYDVVVEAASGERAGVLSIPASDPVISLSWLACIAHSIHPVNAVVIAWPEGGHTPVKLRTPGAQYHVYASAPDERAVKGAVKEALEHARQAGTGPASRD